MIEIAAVSAGPSGLRRSAAALEAKRPDLGLRWSWFSSLAELPATEFPLIVIDLKTYLDADPAAIARLAARRGADLIICNWSGTEPGPWEPALRAAAAITAASRAAACALLDRMIRCVELTGVAGAVDPEADARLHGALIESALARRGRDRPAVSVVVPLYNTPPDYLRELIQSVLGQSIPDWELVLVDDGDPAVTAPVVAEFSDPRIRYYGGLGPRGIAMGRNLGNLLARGKWIAVLDHDDLCAPGRVEPLSKPWASCAGGAIVYTDLIHLWPDGRRELKRLGSFSARDVRRDCQIFHPTVAYEWDTAALVPYDPRFEPADDYQFYLAALRRDDIYLTHIPQPLTIYRWHQGQHSKAALGRQLALAEGARAEDRYLRGGGDPLDRAARFGPTLLALLAHGCDREARELAELGYGPEPLRRAARGEAIGEVTREAAWLALRREGEAAAEEVLRAGLARGRFGAAERCDLVDLLMRLGRFAEARTELASVRRPGRPALASHQELLLGEWERRLGPGGQAPPRLTPRPAGDQAAEVTVIVADSRASSGDQWNRGVADAECELVTFGGLGEKILPAWLAEAAARMGREPELDAVLGQVETRAGETAPGRTVGLGAMFRGERSLLCGWVFRREALARIGGFIPGLGEACEWELMLRALETLNVGQSELTAARNARAPLGADVPGEPERFRERQALTLLVKHLHRPLRHLDLEFSGADPAWLAERLAKLGALLGRSPGLAPFLDPWEYLGEGTDAGHLLSRLSERLGRHGFKAEARAAAEEALREKRFAPRAWARWLRTRW